MVAMVIVVVLLVVVLVSVGATWLMRRRGGDEVHSVEGYQHTLTTLQGIRARSSTGTVRVLGGVDRPPAPNGAPTGIAERPAEEVEAPSGREAAPAGVVGVAGVERTTDIGRPLVFEDASLRGGDGTGERASQRNKDRAMTAMNHRSRRLGAPIVAVVAVVAVAVVLAVVGASSHRRHPRSIALTTAPTTAPSPAGAGTTSTTTTPTTTTTVPAQFLPSSPTAYSATYAAPATTYTVTVTVSSGECWVQLETVAGTTNLFAQTLTAGAQETFPLNTSTTLNLGAPGTASVTMDQKPVVMPGQVASPFTMTFHTPADAAAAGGASAGGASAGGASAGTSATVPAG